MNMSMNMSNDTMDMGGMGPMMPMPMFVYWTSDCWFLFETWHTTEDDHGLFGLGCVLSFLFNIVMFVIPAIQRKVFPSSVGLSNGDTCHNTQLLEAGEKEEKLKRSKRLGDVFSGMVFFFITFFMTCVNMLLLMTFNGWLIISIIVGACVGYVLGEVINLKKTATTGY